MYWYNKPICREKQPGSGAGATKQSRRYKRLVVYKAIIIITLLSTLLLPACKPAIKETGARLNYFDLKGYFKTSATQLTAHNKPVFKTAIHNGNSQSKKVNIVNWDMELSLFSASDINKPAWKDSYQVQNAGNTIFYKTKDPELETKQITINMDGGKVKWIMIINHAKNLLYETKEKLTYVPDSMYRIKKWQHVRLLGTNTYDIKGMITQ